MPAKCDPNQSGPAGGANDRKWHEALTRVRWRLSSLRGGTYDAGQTTTSSSRTAWRRPLGQALIELVCRVCVGRVVGWTPHAHTTRTQAPFKCTSIVWTSDFRQVFSSTEHMNLEVNMGRKRNGRLAVREGLRRSRDASGKTRRNERRPSVH